MTSWNAVKEQYPEAVVLGRTGDFYETYGDDAVAVANALGLTITDTEAGEMCAFPLHSLDLYLPRIIRRGYRVVIAGIE